MSPLVVLSVVGPPTPPPLPLRHPIPHPLLTLLYPTLHSGVPVHPWDRSYSTSRPRRLRQVVLCNRKYCRGRPVSHPCYLGETLVDPDVPAPEGRRRPRRQSWCVSLPRVWAGRCCPTECGAAGEQLILQLDPPGTGRRGDVSTVFLTTDEGRPVQTSFGTRDETCRSEGPGGSRTGRPNSVGLTPRLCEPEWRFRTVQWFRMPLFRSGPFGSDEGFRGVLLTLGGVREGGVGGGPGLLGRGVGRGLRET